MLTQYQPAQQVVFGPTQQQTRLGFSPEILQQQNNKTIDWSARNRQTASDINQVDRLRSQRSGGNNEMFMRFDEDASEVINFVLTGGPKWGFRIRQLNDGRVIVSRVNKGPAEKCGLKVNDELLSVNNVPLTNQPRSLLLHDYPEHLQQQQQQQQQHHLPQQDQRQTNESHNVGDKTPLLDPAAADKENSRTAADSADPVATVLGPLVGARTAATHSIQLAKIDFTYQLIKHSSASNKLMLTVKRYINPAYARASVAATNLSPAQQLGELDDDPTYLRLSHLDGELHYDHQQRPSLATATTKRAHSIAGVHYAYKCCECYCDRQGSGQSDDEENERRLLVQLQTEQRNKLRARQQQQQQQQREAAIRQAREDLQQEDGQEDDEPVPEVPVRRSSRVAAVERSHQQAQQQPQPQPQPQLQSRAPQPRSHQVNRSHSQTSFDPRRELPRPLLADDSDRRPPNETSKRRAISRPSQPPPQPPPPPPPPLPGLSLAGAPALPQQQPLATLTRPRPKRSRAPKNIWSPSTSSATTDSLSNETPVRGAQLGVAEVSREAGAQEVVGPANQSSGAKRSLTDMSSPSSQNTIVEKRHLANAGVGSISGIDFRQATGVGQLDGGAQNKQTSRTNQRSDDDDECAQTHGDGDEISRGVTSFARPDASSTIIATSSSSSPSSSSVVVVATTSDNIGQTCQSEREPTPVESEPSAAGAGAATGKPCWRSMSVSLKPGEKAQLVSRVSAKQGHRSPEMRDYGHRYSLAGSSLPAGAAIVANGDERPPASLSGRYWTLPSGGGGATALRAACESVATGAASSSAALMKPTTTAAALATTTPTATASASTTTSAATATIATHDEANSGAAPLFERPKPKPKQQEEQLYSSSSKRKPSADVVSVGKKEHPDQPEDSSHRDTDIGPRPMPVPADQMETSDRLVAETGRQKSAPHSARDEWFRQMYRQMHKPTAENSLLRAVNEQAPDSRDHFEIKLKSPRKDHRFSPTYYASEEDFQRRHDRNSMSPTFRPGNISDYLPGQSSISQHERNLILYHKLIDHIDRVFSSVLAPEELSRSTNTLQSRPVTRNPHQQLTSRSLKRHQEQMSKSGPQTPVTFRDQTSSLNRNEIKNSKNNEISYHQTIHHHRHRTEPLKEDTSDYLKEDKLAHEKRCVFNRLLKQQDLVKQEPQRDPYHNCQELDSRKQYLAVQQGQDIPLKGLGKPAPQANIYKVGQLPPSFSLRYSEQNDEGRSLTSVEAPRDQLVDDASLSSTRTTSSSDRMALMMNRPALDTDVYSDFESIYESMRRQRPVMQQQQQLQVTKQQSLNREAVFETEQLAKSLADVEEALQRARSPSNSSTYGGKLIGSVSSSRIQSVLADHRPGEVLAEQQSPSPMLSIETASELTARADSRNTNQSYQIGPALVEEMTLSDLEDEISLSLMETSQRRNRNRKLGYLVDTRDGEQMLRASRSRNPLPASVSMRMSRAGPTASSDQLFSDESINIHYRAPTSKLLLKMNTFNEFELNRIKKYYNDQLANRLLQRSKSSRLQSGGGSRPVAALPAGHSSAKTSPSFSSSSMSPPETSRAASRQSSAGGSHHDHDHDHDHLHDHLHRHPQSRHRQAARSADRLHTSASPTMVAGVDLKRYQRAFLTKRAPSADSMRAGSNLRQLRKSVARFGRTLFDFQAKNERELSLKRGDLVEMLELIDHNWAKVEDCQSGLQGLVPLSYIDYSVGCAVARRDVSGQQQVNHSRPQEAPLLPMSKGEPITLIRRLSGHWYEASNTRQANGLVWSNDLDIIKQPVLVASGSPTRDDLKRGLSDNDGDDDDDDDHDEDYEDEEMLILDTGQRVLTAANRGRRARARSASGSARPDPMSNWRVCACSYHSHKQQSSVEQDHCCQGSGGSRKLQDWPGGSSGSGQEPRQPRRSSSSPYIAQNASSEQHDHSYHHHEHHHHEQQTQLPRLSRAKFAYKPRQKDELELFAGDILMVVHECDDGWFIGTSYSSKQTGTFPGNFVEPIP